MLCDNHHHSHRLQSSNKMCECVFCNSEAFSSRSVITVIREGTEPARKPHSYHSLTHRLTHKHMDSHLLCGVWSASPWPPEAPSSLQEDIRVSSRGEDIRDKAAETRTDFIEDTGQTAPEVGSPPRANSGFPGNGELCTPSLASYFQSFLNK